MSSPDPLFSEPGSPRTGRRIAQRGTPPIPGLYIFPGLLASTIAHETLEGIVKDDWFVGGSRDQVMLFTKPGSAILSSSSLQVCIVHLLEALRNALQPRISLTSTETVFERPLARQVILNLYQPGQGISPHVDLPNRYDDGILGVSLVGGTVMSFSKHDTDDSTRENQERYDVYLPPRSVYLLTGEARWDWAHGIEGRLEDVVQATNGVETLLRETRVSVTFRWMKEGGEVLN